MAHKLVELDNIEITVIVDNEIDPISPSNNPEVRYKGLFQGVPMTPIPAGQDRGGAKGEFRMDSICCGAHGLSLMITATKGDMKHTLLFDTGPEEAAWERNAARLKADVGAIERIHLSHWHRDHSGGLIQAIKLINGAKSADQKNVAVDLHPDRPEYRGMMTPMGVPLSLEADPSFADIETAGGLVEKSSESHTVLDDMFLVSGEISRETAYELGITGGIRYTQNTGNWTKDELIADERLVMCNLKGKGLVVFTGCSHAGVINVCKHALNLGRGVPLYGVVGGFHLADNNPDKLKLSLEDLKKLEPKVLMPGHCTGFKFKFMIEQSMPAVIAPSYSGTTYILSSADLV